MKAYVFQDSNGGLIFDINQIRYNYDRDGFAIKLNYLGTLDLPIEKPEKTVRKEFKVPDNPASVNFFYHNHECSFPSLSRAKNIKISYEVEE